MQIIQAFGIFGYFDSTMSISVSFYYRNYFCVLYVGYSIWSGKKGNSNINHSAHLWGAAYGVIVTIIIEPRLIPHFLQQLAKVPFL